jgi:hypothetical protein
LNRHAALNALNDRINLEGSGHEERLGRTKPNKGFDPTGISSSLIENLGGFGGVSRRVNPGVMLLPISEVER